MAFVEPLGLVITPEELTIPKARELARYVLSGVHPYVRLLETRRFGQRESVVLTITDLEVGQAPRVPLNDEERFEIAFYPEDAFAPQVLALRADFPNAPHVNRTFEEFPRSLCLYETPYPETKLSWTPGRLIERIRVWIRDTALGVLHRDEQPLEPILMRPELTLILPSDLFSKQEDETPNKLLVFGISQSAVSPNVEMRPLRNV